MNHFRHIYNLGEHWYKKFKKKYKDLYEFVFDNEKLVVLVYDQNKDHVLTYLPDDGTVFTDLPINKVYEDAMGGVGAPMATLNNTPGMGNVTPAGPGSIGSGDKFGNTFGNATYTQNGKAKKKKKPMKKVTKKLEEENLNPYDKVGISMAKKMKVTPPFKKKRDSKNQNAMVQRKFEHEIITLDEFTKQLNEEFEYFNEDTPLIASETSGATYTTGGEYITTLRKLKQGGWELDDEELEDLRNGKTVGLLTFNRVGTARRLNIKRADIEIK